jgi:signal peptidase I
VNGSLLSLTSQTPVPVSPPQTGSARKKPVLALICSLLSDGLGQIYNGEMIKGLVFALASWVLLLLGFSYLMSSFLGLILFIALTLAFKIYLCADAFLFARKLLVNTTRPKPPLALRIGAATLILGVVLYITSDSFFKKFLAYHAFKIPSASMCPTICEGDRMVADLRAFRGSAPQRGDVVIFLFDSETSLHIKRVAAVGGDEVSASHGHVIVNGNSVESPSSACGIPPTQSFSFETSPDLAPLRVPPNKLFLIGDNLDHSYDSRYYGAVEVSRVRGRPVYLYWSPQHARIGCRIK